MNGTAKHSSDTFQPDRTVRQNVVRRYTYLKSCVDTIKRSSFFSEKPKFISEIDSKKFEVISSQLSMLAENARRIEELEALNKSYQEALRFVAHEIKNPVASMITNAQLLVEGYLGDITPTQKQKVERIAHNGRYLISFIDSYLDLARIEHAEQVPRHVDIDDLAAEVLEPAVELLRGQAEGRSIEVITDFPDHVVTARGNPELLRVVAINLIGNAIKYGNNSGIVRVTMKDLGDRAEVTVWNDGPGFPPEKSDDLFLQFSRQNTPELIRRKGTGLGLYTCWKIIQMHGGDVWAESEQGSWASFSFHIPMDSTMPPVRRFLPGDGDHP